MDELLDIGGEEELLSKTSVLSTLSLTSALLSTLEEDSSFAQATASMLGVSRQSATISAAKEFLLFIIFSPF